MKTYDAWTWVSLIVLAIPMVYLILISRIWGTVASLLLVALWAYIDDVRIEIKQ